MYTRVLWLAAGLLKERKEDRLKVKAPLMVVPKTDAARTACSLAAV